MKTKLSFGFIVFCILSTPAFSKEWIRNIGNGEIGSGADTVLTTYTSDDESYACINVSFQNQTSKLGNRGVTECYRVTSVPRITKGAFDEFIDDGNRTRIQEFKMWDSANNVVCGGSLHKPADPIQNTSVSLSCIKVDSLPSSPSDRRANIGSTEIVTLVNPARPAKGDNVEHRVLVRMMSDYESYACITAHAWSRLADQSGGTVVSTSCYPVSNEPNYSKSEFPDRRGGFILKTFVFADQANNVVCGGSLMDSAGEDRSNLSISISCAVQ